MKITRQTNQIIDCEAMTRRVSLQSSKERGRQLERSWKQQAENQLWAFHGTGLI